MSPRLNKAIQRLSQEKIDALLVSHRFNIKYLTGFRGEDAFLLLSKKDRPVYFTDSRYIAEAKKFLPQYEIIDIKYKFAKIISDTAARLRIKRLGFETRHIPHAEYARLTGYLGNIRLKPVMDFVEVLREIKEPVEIKKIQRATDIAVDALQFASEQKLAGKREKQVADQLENRMRKKGASSSSFEIIVASGPNSSFPHAQVSGKTIRKTDPVLVDIGASLSGYNSDLTRMFFSGKIYNSEIERIYSIVQEAKSLSINKIRPGVSISSIDKTARDFIAGQGFGSCFGHSLGHGIGLEVHEGPRISGNNQNLLEEGMVFTIEPAIYLPYKFGIRLEDMVLVTKRGAKVLNGSLFD